MDLRTVTFFLVFHNQKPKMTRELQVQTISIAKRCLFLISMLLTTLVANAQYSGYVGDSFTIPDPPDRYGYTAMNATFSSSSAHLYVDRYGWCQIRSYFTGTQTVICTCLYVRSDGTVGGNVPYTQTYYVTCKARNITGLPSSVTMEEGEEKTLSWDISPYSASAQVTWSTSNSSIVAVSQNGKLTAKSAGTAVVTAENNSGPDVNVYVTVNEGKKLSLIASPAGSEVLEGSQVSLTCNREGADIYYTLNGSTPSKSSTKYTSPITINEACTLKAIAYKDGYETSEVLTENYTVKEIIAPSGIIVTADSKTIGVGDKVNASYSILPSEANTSLAVTWSSDDKSIATINSSGQITGIKEGVTYIRATTANGIEGSWKIRVMADSYVFDDGVGVASVATSGFHTLIVKKDGTFWACGRNSTGELCDGTKNNSITPKFIMSNVASVSAGSQLSSGNSFIVKRDGTLWVCGVGSYGPLGTGSGKNVSVPTKIMEDVLQVKTTGYKTHILKKDGTLWACGWNNSFGLGIGSQYEGVEKLTPVKILSNVAQLTPGGTTMAIKKDNTLWAWGENEYGELGDGTTTARTAPIQVMNDVVTASSNFVVTCAVKKDGTLWSCGGNKYHYLCDGTQNSQTFKHVMDNVKLALNCSMYFIIKQDGSLWGYGSNDYGQLGIGTKGDVNSPVKIMEDADSIMSNSFATFVRKKDGSLWAFGTGNSNGQLGDGTTEQRILPVKIMDAPNGKPYEITLQYARDSIEIGKIMTITCLTKPSNATVNLTWSSDDPTIATVDATGTVKGIKSGTTYINAETENGKVDWFKITVYVPNIERTVKTSAAGYATFYDSELAYVLPEGLNAQVVTNASNDKLSYQTIANGNNSGLIPAGVPVMLVSNQKSAASYQLKSTWSEETYSGNNLLHGSDEATTTTGDGYHYKLSYGKSGSNMSNVFGWYWGTQNGGAFQIEGHKAWLVIPKSSAATRGFAIDGNATGIDSLTSEEPENAVYYDLQGRRIDKPAKGVYISRGKKVIIK